MSSTLWLDDSLIKTSLGCIYLRLLKCEEFGLELADVTPETLSRTLINAWDNRVALQEQQRPTIRDLKAGARR